MMHMFDIIDLKPLKSMTKIYMSGSPDGLRNLYYAYYEGNISGKVKADQISKHQLVEYAEPKYRHYLCDTPNDFHPYQQNNYNAVYAPEAWDVIKGDRSLFLRYDEVEYAWRVIDPVLRAWAMERDYISTYPAGSWGPRESRRLFEKEGQRWRHSLQIEKYED